jgi:hypothetical protein
MKRHLALAIMGGWVAGLIAMSVVATENFYTVDRLLAARQNPAFALLVDRLGAPQTRDLLRYLSSELNRLYFQSWNVMQIALGALALWLLAGFERQDPAVTRTETRQSSARARSAARGVWLMLLLAVVITVWPTPAIVTLGRSLDFVPRDPPPPGLQRFWILHATYTALELMKLVAGGVVIYTLARLGPVRDRMEDSSRTASTTR